MRYIFLLRDSNTNEIKEYIDKFEWKNESEMKSMWIDGYLGCDCQRSIIFYGSEKLKCNKKHENVISIEEVFDINGNIVQIK